MTKFVDQLFETEPADSNGVAVLKPVSFRASDNTAIQISLRTYDWISNDDRCAKLKLWASACVFDDVLRYRGDLYGPGGPLHPENLIGKERYASGGFRDNNNCLPPLPPYNCKNPQAPFDLKDHADDPGSSPVEGSVFLVNGTLDKFPEGTIIHGLMLLIFL